jgi:hypothetical protein
MRGEPVYVDDLLEAINGMPLLLLWGDSDPWMVPDRVSDTCERAGMRRVVIEMCGPCHVFQDTEYEIGQN